MGPRQGFMKGTGALVVGCQDDFHENPDTEGLAKLLLQGSPI